MKTFFKEKLGSFDFWWWFGLLIFTCLLHGNHVMNNDEGVILEGAWNLLQGKELYLDFFEFVTPGSFYLVFWAWTFFGAHYLIANMLAVVALFLGAIGVYKIAELIDKNKINYLIPAIILFSSFQWPLINHNLFNAVFLVWAILFFLKGLRSEGYKNFVLSGILIGFAILFLQTKGLAVWFGCSSFLLYLSFKEKDYCNLFKKNSIFILTALAVMIVLFLKWPIKLLYSNLIEFVLFNYRETNQISLAYFVLFCLVLAFSFIVLYKEKRREISALLWLQLILLISALSRPDSYHIALSIFPLLSVSFFVIRKINNRQKFFKKACQVCLGGFIFLFIYPSIKYVAGFPLFYSIKDQGAIAFIKENCPGKEDLYAGPFVPGMYYETEKINPTPFGWLITNHQTKEQFKQAREILEKKKPKCVVTHYSIMDKFNYEINNPVDNFIKEEYHEVYKEADLVVSFKTVK